jgi:hypothetical protein
VLALSRVLDVVFLIIVAVLQRRHLLQGLSANTPEEPAALNISQAAATFLPAAVTESGQTGHESDANG